MKSRIYFLDNLRTAMIFLVVLYHSGAVYESSGFFATFWLVDDPSTNVVVGIVNVLIDIFIMPTIFFPCLKMSGGAFGVTPTRKIFMSGPISADSVAIWPVDTHPVIKDKPAIKKIRTNRCLMLSFFGILFVPPYQSVFHITY